MAESSEIFGLSTRRGVLLLAVVFVGLLVVASPHALGQDYIGDDLAPPPVKAFSQAEKLKLTSQTEVKKRTKLALDLMEARLKQAEVVDAAENYDEMFVQLGAFHGLMDNTLEFLNQSDKDNTKVLNNFKRFEIGLRSFMPRLQMIHYDAPVRYEHYVRTLIRYLRSTRAKAIEPLFDDTVVPNKKPAGSL